MDLAVTRTGEVAWTFSSAVPPTFPSAVLTPDPWRSGSGRISLGLNRVSGVVQTAFGLDRAHRPHHPILPSLSSLSLLWLILRAVSKSPTADGSENHFISMAFVCVAGEGKKLSFGTLPSVVLGFKQGIS